MQFYSPHNSPTNSQTTFTKFKLLKHSFSKLAPEENINSVQNVLRMQQKEIKRLEHQNSNLQILIEHQTSLLKQERSIRTISIKPQNINPQQNKIQKRQTLQNVLQAMRPATKRNTYTSKLSMQINQNECFKLSNILDGTIEEAKKMYKEDSSIQLINQTLIDEDHFVNIISTYPPQQVSIVYDKLKKILTEHEDMFKLILKLRQLIDIQFNLANIKLQQEALNKLAEQAKSVFECRRIQFVTEQHHQCDFLEEVQQNKQLLNLKNAKYDLKFKDYDFTQLLAAPILDNQVCLGVVACYDKIDKDEKIFSDNDEIMIKYVTRQALNIINNQISTEKLEISLQKFRHALKSLLELLLLGDKDDVIESAQQRLNELMNSNHSKIVIKEQNQELQGIMSLATTSNSLIFINNAYNHQLFQPDIDINTQLPIVVFPISYKEQLVGCAQFVQSSSTKLSQMDQEILDLFIQILGVKLNHLLHNQF